MKSDIMTVIGLCARRTISSFIFVTISLFISAQQPMKCLAVITDMIGEVVIHKANTNMINAFWGAQLSEGDIIRTSKASGVALLFSDGNLVNLGAESNIEITRSNENQGSSGSKSIKGDPSMIATFSALTMKRENKNEVGILADLRSVNTDLPIELISPCNTFIKLTNPSFTWQADESMDEFIVSLFNNKGLVWSKKVSGNQLEYPEDEKELTYGESYFWHVEGDIMLESYKSLNQEFSILPPGKINDVVTQEENIKDLFSDDLNSGSYHSVLGAYYMNNGLFEEAIKEFTRVSEINPDAALPHEILGRLYTDVGKKDLAISELQKALQLAKKAE
jgi:hypothetical protein